MYNTEYSDDLTILLFRTVPSPDPDLDKVFLT